MSAFVFNCEYNGLGIIHSLGRKGIPVFALDTYRSVGTFSKYAKYCKVNDPLSNELGFIEDLMSFCITDQIKPLLLPTNDHWAEAVSKNADILSSKYTLCSPSYNVIQLLLDKYMFAKWTMERNIVTPKIWTINEIEQMSTITYPIAVKAKARRRIGQLANGNEIAKAADDFRFIKCFSRHELINTITSAKKKGVDVYCQQVVNGDSSNMITIGIFANKGELKGIIYGKKIRGFPPEYGDCIVGEAYPVPQWALNLAHTIVKILKYTGIAEIELMKDSKTNEKYIIEVNPRSWSWVGVCEAAGVDLAWIAYQELILQKNLQLCTGTTGPVRYIKVIPDFMNVAFKYKNLGFKSWSNNPLNWFRELRLGKRKQVLAEFPKDDLKITLYAFTNILVKFFKNIIKKLLIKNV